MKLFRPVGIPGVSFAVSYNTAPSYLFLLRDNDTFWFERHGKAW